MKRLFPDSGDEAPPREAKQPGEGPQSIGQPCTVNAAGSSQGNHAQSPLVCNDASSLVSDSSWGGVEVPWPARLQTFTREAGETASVKQSRPIRMHTIFSGIGSPRQAFKDMGYEVEEYVMAERKLAARDFCFRNHLHPMGCFFEDVEELVNSGMGKCVVHGSACCLPSVGADILVAGFPCTPFSRQTHAPRDFDTIAGHREFEKMAWTVRFIEISQPKLVVLENVPNFAGLNSCGTPWSAGETSFCDVLCQKLEALGYAVGWSFLELEPWVEASGSRIYITAVSNKVPRASEAARETIQRISKVQQWRARTPPKSWKSCLLERETPQWLLAHDRWLVGSLYAKTPGRKHARNADEHEDEVEGRWSQEARAFREVLARKGRPYHDASLWTEFVIRGEAPSLLGVPRPVTARKLELLDLGVAYAYHSRDLDEVSERTTLAVVDELIADLSQNPARRPWADKLKRLTRTSRPYSFSEDRLLFPEDLFRIYGWVNPDVSALTYAEAVDLLGDSMALPTLGVVLDSIMVSCRSSLSDLWSA